jgi:hypothetical protein
VGATAATDHWIVKGILGRRFDLTSQKLARALILPLGPAAEISPPGPQLVSPCYPALFPAISCAQSQKLLCLASPVILPRMLKAIRPKPIAQLTVFKQLDTSLRDRIH